MSDNQGPGGPDNNNPQFGNNRTALLFLVGLGILLLLVLS